MTAAVNQRYTGVAITLHWLIAAAIIGQIGLGWFMDNQADGASKFANYQLHKSIGITILILSIARVTWRLMNPPPPEPPMPGWQAALAKTVHVGLYALIIIMPLTGWIMVSASTSGVATTLFKTVAWPHVPGFEGMGHDARESIEGQLGWVHSKLAWVAIGLLVLHVAGALKHQFADKDHLLARMAPGLFGRTAGPPQKAKGVIPAFGIAIGLFIALAAYATVQRAPAAQPPETPPAALAANDQAQTPPSGPSSTAPSWAVDASKSSIAFTGAYMGRPFTGKFKDWTAAIQFDPAKPQDARIRVTIKTGSAATGEPYYDDNLKEGDWFNTQKSPEAVFRVTEGVTKSDDTHFEATGVLNIKGIDYPLRLPFTLNVAGAVGTMHAEVPVSRTGYKIGNDTLTEAKGDKEWVADEVKLTIDVVATRQ